MIGGIKNMKKFINPEMNVARFDVENIITTSAQGTSAEDAAKQAIATNGIKIGNNTYTDVETLTLVF